MLKNIMEGIMAGTRFSQGGKIVTLEIKLVGKIRIYVADLSFLSNLASSHEAIPGLIH